MVKNAVKGRKTKTAGASKTTIKNPRNFKKISKINPIASQRFLKHDYLISLYYES